MITRYLLLFLLFFTGLSWNGNGQSTFKFKHLGPEQGLSHPSVTCIIKDRNGFMWFGTRDGLNRYDSYEFHHYINISGDTTSLSNNTISYLFEDHLGFIWVGTEGGGLNRYDPLTDRFERFVHDPGRPATIPHNSIGCITEDRSGVIWVATMGGGLCRFDRETEQFMTYTHDPDDPNSLGSDMVISVMQDEDGLFWLATEGAGLGRFDSEKGTFTHYRHDPGDPASISTDLIRTIFEDREGRLWLGSWGFGINIFDRQTERFTHIRYDPESPDGLPNGNVFAICDDPQGNIWIGTRSGLSKYDPHTKAFTHLVSVAGNPYSLADNVAFSLYYSRSDEILWVGTWGNGINYLDRYGRQTVHFHNNPDNKNSLNDNDVFSILEDRQGILWIGTEGGGLNRYDPVTGAFKHFVHDPDDPNSLSNDEVMCIHQDKNGQLWIGTFGGGLNIFDPVKETFRRYRGNPAKPFDFRTILTLYEDSKGFLWATSSLEGVARIDPGTGSYTLFEHRQDHSSVQIFEEVLAIIEDHTGAMWFGTRNLGLYRLDPASGEFTSYTHDPTDPGSLGTNAIYTFHEDPEGNLWIGTRGAGLNILHIPAGDSPVFHKITTLQGLANDWVLGIQEDQHGNIWASGSGISEILADSREVRRFYFTESNQGAFYKSPQSGSFYMGSSGFDRFHPDSIPDVPGDHEIIISKFNRYNTVEQSGVPISIPGIYTYDSLTLSYRDKVLTIEFLSLDYSEEGDRQYVYQLENFNNDWIQLGEERKITFTGLSPGKYMLHVKTVSFSGRLSRKEAKLSLSILPPWWRSRLAYVAYILLFLLGLFSYIRLRTRKLTKDKEALEHVVKTRTREIAEQKDEIETQRDQLKTQRDLVLKQKSEILDSISYAQRIQAAMLPPLSYINELLHENFILYQPKNIVSGDFYWAKRVNQKTILVAADCTGHGVPGAFMSMLGISFLDEIVGKREITQASEVLNELRHQIKHALRQQGLPDESKDSIDMAICVLDKGNRSMQYSGANNSLFLVKEVDGTPQLIEIKPDRMPLGYYMGKDKPFTNHKIQLDIGTTFYIFTDGFADQKGGKDNKKFMIKHFKTLLLKIHDQPMYKQKILLEKTLEEWKNGFDQIDDILVMGIKV